MNKITKLFEDASTESFNKIDDEALGQLGSEIERIQSVQEQIELTELKVKKLKEEEQVLADSISDKCVGISPLSQLRYTPLGAMIIALSILPRKKYPPISSSNTLDFPVPISIKKA